MLTHSLMTCLYVGCLHSFISQSTLLSKFKFESAPSATEHTKSVELYKWPCAKNFLFIDFPGGDDVQEKVRCRRSCLRVFDALDTGPHFVVLRPPFRCLPAYAVMSA